jgi:hypothetical protein
VGDLYFLDFKEKSAKRFNSVKTLTADMKDDDDEFQVFYFYQIVFFSYSKL